MEPNPKTKKEKHSRYNGKNDPNGFTAERGSCFTVFTFNYRIAGIFRIIKYITGCAFHPQVCPPYAVAEMPMQLAGCPDVFHTVYFISIDRIEVGLKNNSAF